MRNSLDDILMALFCDAHILLVGVPGLAKTLMISTLAQVLHLSFKRVQFTPDMLPGDITGSIVVEHDPASGKREFRFVPGPVFTNVLRPSALREQKSNYLPTIVRWGASIGANATIVCGVGIGQQAFVGAGSVVTRNVPAGETWVGVPARKMRE